MRLEIHIVTFVLVLAGAAQAAEYPREHIYDTRVFAADAAVNVSLVNARWPDCTTLESAVRDIFRIEGVADKSDHDKAQALWKWFRILVSSTGGGYVYEGPAGARDAIVYDPAKIFAVYGHHQCDGLSWAMAPLWRAAGYMAFDECTHGHTTAALRYRDADGVARYHSFDPQGRFFYWDAAAGRVGTRSMPVMTGMVYRHVTAPQRLHSLRTSLRIGETVERLWDNRGRVIAAGRPGQPIYATYYQHKDGRTDGVYAIAGEQVRTLTVRTDPASFARQLHEGSANAACSPPTKGKATLHPAEAAAAGVFVYRLPPPYVIVDATLRATLVKTDPDDLCRISISRDGGKWATVFDKKTTGVEEVALELGRAAQEAGGPDLFTAYDALVKVECATAGDPRGVGINAMEIATFREANKRTWCNLMPGENVFRLDADRLADDQAIELDFRCRLAGKDVARRFTVARTPFYFRIDAPDAPLAAITNYDQKFNLDPVRTVSCRMRLVPRAGAAPSESLAAEQGSAAFQAACPHPASMVRQREVKVPETDPAQTSGHFPQGGPAGTRPAGTRPAGTDPQKMAALIARLNSGSDSDIAKWNAAQELGGYPEAADALCRKLPSANIDLTLFICKALARIADKRALEPLLAKWAKAPANAPGGRYIPDALAALGDRRAVAPLVAKLPHVRFDFRFHIAHALGILGGPEAVKALEELAANDPFPAVREEARAGLEKSRTARVL